MIIPNVTQKLAEGGNERAENRLEQRGAVLPPDTAPPSVPIDFRPLSIPPFGQFLSHVRYFPLLCLSLLAYPGYFEPWGSDADLKHEAQDEVEIPRPSIAATVADAIIRFHQTVISPVDGPRSHFRPTSSRYMQLAMQRYGFLKGFIMGCDRLLRENNEEWVYRTIEIDGQFYKYDPARVNKY